MQVSTTRTAQASPGKSLLICWWNSGLVLDFTCTLYHCSLTSTYRLSRATSHSSSPCISRKLEERTTWSIWAMLKTSSGRSKVLHSDLRKTLDPVIFCMIFYAVLSFKGHWIQCGNDRLWQGLHLCGQRLSSRRPLHGKKRRAVNLFVH